MVRHIRKLSALGVSKAKRKGLYADGGNLYLQISPSGSKSWIFRYMHHNKARSMGLGALHTVSLAEARERAADCRKLLTQGFDPIKARQNNQANLKLAASRAMSFKECAAAYIEAHKTGWRNAKHVKQWESTLSTYAFPIIGNLSAQDIDIALVMKVIEPIWKKKTETASRLRGRIESILDWATVRGYRVGENPARWRGRLESLLPKRSKVQKVQHHPALAYDDLPEFLQLLEDETGLAAQALKLVILTATRTSEVIGARWSEINLKAKLWIIPANRIKAAREHRIPLSDAALAILRRLEKLKEGEFVFLGVKDKPLSNMALLALLKRLGRSEITVHGFRSTFRDWAAEQTNYPREVAEQALAHAIGDKVEAAYRRGDLFEKRRQLLNAWARYCYQPRSKAKVLKINR